MNPIETTITIGTGATKEIGSDRYPYTVVSVSPSGKTLVLQADSIRGKGIFVADPTGDTVTVRWSAKRECFVAGRCGHYYIGARRAYMDPSF